MNFSQFARPLCLTGLLLASTGAFAELSPAGDWRVADCTATIRIHRCGGVWCGRVVSTITPAGKDIHNPDPRKRNRTVLGLEVLYGLRANGANDWAGYSYNAQDGQTKLGLNQFKDLKLPISEQSVAGYCATHRCVINIADVYDDEELAAYSPHIHFLKEVDKRTGYRTKQMLCAPVLDNVSRELIGSHPDHQLQVRAALLVDGGGGHHAPLRDARDRLSPAQQEPGAGARQVRRAGGQRRHIDRRARARDPLGPPQEPRHRNRPAGRVSGSPRRWARRSAHPIP